MVVCISRYVCVPRAVSRDVHVYPVLLYPVLHAPGAELANVVNEAALYAARNVHAKVMATDLDYAIERVIGGTAKKNTVGSITC